MAADTLLQHLKKVKRTQPGSWLACCPAHEDKSPSLAIRELNDGRVLVHCFASCSAEQILSAVGLTFDDLYPEKQIHHARPERNPFPAMDVLRAISNESLITYLAAKSVGKGQTLGETDIARLLVATSRIQAALVAGGIHAP